MLLSKNIPSDFWIVYFSFFFTIVENHENPFGFPSSFLGFLGHFNHLRNSVWEEAVKRQKVWYFAVKPVISLIPPFTSLAALSIWALTGRKDILSQKFNDSLMNFPSWSPIGSGDIFRPILMSGSRTCSKLYDALQDHFGESIANNIALHPFALFMVDNKFLTTEIFINLSDIRFGKRILKLKNEGRKRGGFARFWPCYHHHQHLQITSFIDENYEWVQPFLHIFCLINICLFPVKAWIYSRLQASTIW